MAKEFKAEPVPAEKFYKDHPRPVVLFYQPESFAVLKDPADLRKWEANMREKVGLSPFQVGAQTETPCETCSAGCSDACDTD
jgi:hypothetical protein